MRQTELGEPAAAPLLLTTKLHPPPRREHTIARDRLLERLRAPPGTKLTVVAAPAGCGKSTLLSAWRELEEAATPVAWLTLDAGDNDPVVLWSYVLAALRQACPGLAASASPELVNAARIVDVVLPQLVNDLIEQGDVTLILDDFHRLSSGAARDSLAWLVDHAPSTFRLVIASRREPAFPLGALRAHGELLEVRADELGFTSDEAEALLNGRLELGLSRDDVDDLVERTEGWPAGLYLAALSLQAIEDRHAFVDTFGGRSRHVVDFLVDEVLDAHDPGTQMLMLRSSILPRLCGPLCDAVLDEEGAAERLAALARTNLFLVPLDDRGEWYRFHHLFAQLLRVELEHREPGAARTLHRRAYAWHRDHGSVDEAIEHAVEAGAFAEAAELIAAAWIGYVNASRHTTVLEWLRRLPYDVLRDQSHLLTVHAWVLSLCGRREEAAETIAAVERLGHLDAGPLPDGFSSIEASLATLRGTITWGDVGSGLEHGRRAAELEGPRSRWRPVACCGLGLCLYFDGRPDEADRWLAESAELAPLHEQWRVAATSLAYRSLLAGDEDRLGQQVLLADQALALARERGLEEVDGDALVAFGASLQARGELDEAVPALERGVAVTRAAGFPRELAHALIRLAAALQAAGRREDAAARIDDAERVVAACPDPRILAERLAALQRPRHVRRRTLVGALSERELVILRMLTGRLSERDIGRELYLSHNTIHSHTRSIYRKLGVSSRSEALAHARELGLL
jgi:ATP/maltotriose-dependent transcriptional regulator MalT